MTKYTFIAEPFDKKIKVFAETEKDAHKKAFDSLSGNERDALEYLDLVEDDSDDLVKMNEKFINLIYNTVGETCDSKLKCLTEGKFGSLT